MRNVVFYGILLSTVLFICGYGGYSAAQTPEQVVHEFYKWYFIADSGSTLAENNDEILQYVDKRTVENIRKDTSDIYYFTKVGSYSSDWKSADTIVGNSINTGKDVFIIPVTFALKYSSVTVVVFVQRNGDRFLISKVVDTYPYS